MGDDNAHAAMARTMARDSMLRVEKGGRRDHSVVNGNEKDVVDLSLCCRCLLLFSIDLFVHSFGDAIMSHLADQMPIVK
jgi:hypothetical protein